MMGTGFVGGLLLLSSLMKHIVFQRTHGAASTKASTQHAGALQNSPFNSNVALQSSSVPTPAATSTENPPQNQEIASGLRVSGKLRLHEQCAARFLDVPAAFVRLPSGELAVASNIDASSRMYGQVTDRRIGIWLIVPQPRTLKWENGCLYNGFKPLPALRLRYADALDKGKTSTAIVAFDNEAARDHFATQLQAETVR
jgi:hypothetical protein